MTTSSDDTRHGTGPFGDLWWLLLVVAGFLMYLLAAVPRHFVESQGGDFPYYVQIAASPLDNDVPSPWRYRLLNPLLASGLMRLGVSTNAAFLALTTTFAFVSCVLMGMHLRQLGLSTFAARTGTLLFAVSVGAYIPMRRYYGYTDALTNAFILLVLVTTAAHRYGATVVAVGLGVFAKESVLLAVPFVARRWSRVVSWRRLAVLLAVPAVIFVALRAVVDADSSRTSPVALSLETQFDYWSTAMVHGPLRWLLWSFAYSFGPIWLLAALAVRHNLAFLGRTWLYALPIVIPLMRTTDTERALMLLFPLVIPLAAYAVDGCRSHRRALSIATLAVACAWLAQLTFGWIPQLRIGVLNAKDMAFALLCIVPAAAVVVCRNTARVPTPLSWQGSGQ